METDHAVRLSLLVIWGLVAPLAAYFRWRSITAEKLDRWQEGAFILFGLRLGAIPYALGIGIWMIDPRQLAWAALDLPTWARWLGIVLVAAASLLLVWTFSHLGKNLTDTVVTRRSHTLVTSGPYRFVRHPFYSTFFLGNLGIALALANGLIIAAGIVPIAFLVARTSIEEKKLLAHFGQAYGDYMDKVGRFVPTWRRGG